MKSVTFVALLILSISLVASIVAGLVFISDIIYKRDQRPALIAIESKGNMIGSEAIKKDVLPLLQENAGDLWLNADAQRGAKLFRQCLICHNAQKNGPNGVGPNLYDVYKRRPASLEKFPYSKAMRNFGETHKIWDYQTLNLYLEAPKKVVVGTSMAFFGIKKARDRADLIRYLKCLPR